jgi:hypothetical protein
MTGERMSGKVHPGMCTPEDPCGGGSQNAEIVQNQMAQITSYYCGPASVREAIAARSVYRNQDQLASEMGTDSDGTDWYNGTYPVRDALNNWLGSQGGQYAAVNLDYSPTQAQINSYKNRLTADIVSAWPLIGNAWEVSGGPHLVGHPQSSTIFHYVELRGYTSSGDNTKYEDTVHGASSISWSAGVPAYSTMDSGTIATIFGGRGYIW